MFVTKASLIFVFVFFLLTACIPVAAPEDLPTTAPTPTLVQTQTPESVVAAENTPVHTPTPTDRPEIVEFTPTTTSTSESEPQLAFPGCPPGDEIVPCDTFLRTAYLEQGNLWSLDTNEGEPQQLSQDGLGQEILLSPDGTLIVYSRLKPNGNWEIQVVDYDNGQARSLTTDQSFSGQLFLGEFSDDQALLWFTLQFPEGGGELWVTRTDGGSARRLLDSNELKSLVVEPLADFGVPANVQWVPGTHRIFFDAAPQFSEGGIYIYVQNQVVAADADTGDYAVLLPAGEGGLVEFSPNGGVMLLKLPDRLQSSDVESVAPITLDVPYQAIGMGEFYMHPELSWINGETILLAQPDPKFAYESSSPVTLYQVPLDGSPSVKVQEWEGHTISYQFSPDASRLGMWTALPQSNERQLQVGDVASGALQTVDEGDLLEFRAWSPDNQHFLFVSGQPAKQKLHLGDVCAEPGVLAELSSGFDVRWVSPQSFVVTVFRGSEQELLQGYSDGRLETILRIQTPGKIVFNAYP